MNEINSFEELYYPNEVEKSNDFIGFTFNGIDSSFFNIVRTSGGSRYDEGIIPAISDKTAQVPGGDGTYFFGSYYTQKPIQVEIAFDNLTEKKMREMRLWLSDKKIHDLTFYEEPYKTYKAKLASSPTLSYICFDELDENGNEIRIYKGEGTLSFVCYYPFSYCSKKTLDQYSEYKNVDEWALSSGIRTQKELTDNEIDVLNNISIGVQTIKVYNPGDLDTDFILDFNVPNQLSREKLLEQTAIDGSISYDAINSDYYLIINLVDSVTLQKLTMKIPLLVEYEKDKFSEMGLNGTNGIRYNSKLHLIEGLYDGKVNGKVFNNLITIEDNTGDFFKIAAVGDSQIKVENRVEGTVSNIGMENINLNNFFATNIDYNYLYY